MNDTPPTPFSTAYESPTRERHLPVLNQQLSCDVSVIVSSDLPSGQYVGWPWPKPDDNGLIYKGPIEGTKADIMDFGIMDSGAFECEFTREPLNDDIEFFNFSTSSVLKTIHQRQRVSRQELRLHLPPKDEATHTAQTFLEVMWHYYPIVHKASFLDLVDRLYDSPHTLSLAEEIQVVQMLGILSHQSAIRNQGMLSKVNDFYQYLHYALGHFPDLMKDSSLASMQALAMILLQFRNMPKPGYTCNIAQEMLMRCIDLDYHRDPEKVALPPVQQNFLAKELRKRVFHAILGVCIATGCRLGRPAPWQFVHWDVPLPMPILDSEMSVNGLSHPLSGRCDFWPTLQLAKLLPLYTELHNYVLSVRRSPADYHKIVEALQTKIDAWRADWDSCTANEDKSHAHFSISSLLIDSWAAEYIMLLHHPLVCAANTQDVIEKNLDVCQKAAKRMLSNFHTLSNKYKAADFSWHSVVAYTLGFGLTLHVQRRRLGPISQECFRAIKNEFAGWLSLMAAADFVLKTAHKLQGYFFPFVEQVQIELAAKVSNGRIEGQGTRTSFASVNGQQSRNGSVIKQESGLTPYCDSLPCSDWSEMVGGQSNGLHYQQHHPGYGASPVYQTSQSTVAPTSYPMYSQPNVPYPNLPTSLAPLLNETPPNTMAQYPHPTISVQDPSMMFSPHLYMDAATVWPLLPDGQYAG